MVGVGVEVREERVKMFEVREGGLRCDSARD